MTGGRKEAQPRFPRFNYLEEWYVRVDGEPIARGFDELLSGTLRNPISLDILGTEVSTLVWTGTESDGTAGGNDCSSWTSRSGQAGVGLTDQVDADWTDDVIIPCSGLLRLYCFPQ